MNESSTWLEEEDLGAEDLLWDQDLGDALVEPTWPPDIDAPRTHVLDRFPLDSSALSAEHEARISRISHEIAVSLDSPRPVRTVALTGHTDARGAASYNQELGLRRARSVARSLMEALAQRVPSAVNAVGFFTRSEGEAQPVASNSTAAGQARNRRVVIVLSRARRAIPAPVSLTVQNAFLPTERVRNCRVVLQARVPVFGRTHDNGGVRLDLSSVPDGVYPLQFLPEVGWNGPVGPTTAERTPRPERIWRSLSLEVEVSGGRIVRARHPQVQVRGDSFIASLVPVWMASPNRGPRPAGQAVQLVTIHHTAEERMDRVLNTFLRPGGTSAHYLISPRGEVVKLVHESQMSHHAGASFWRGRDSVNPVSVGIELAHRSGPYPQAQMQALRGLLLRIRRAHPRIPVAGIVGHSDIATCPAPGQCENTRPRQLGRKAGDPGLTFDWPGIEQMGLGLRALRRPGLDIYGGYFRLVGARSLRQGDSDRLRRHGGIRRPTFTRPIITELQRDLRDIGYFCPVTGVFNVQTEAAVRMFQEHMFSGSRRNGIRDDERGQVNARTAAFIKAVRP